MEKKAYLIAGLLTTCMMLGGVKTEVQAAGQENIAYQKSVWVSSTESSEYAGANAFQTFP